MGSYLRDSNYDLEDMRIVQLIQQLEEDESDIESAVRIQRVRGYIPRDREDVADDQQSQKKRVNNVVKDVNEAQPQTNDDNMEESPPINVEKNDKPNSREFKKLIGRAGSDRFTAKGFNKWKKINCGKDCAFIKMKVGHIENVIEKQTTQEIMDNRLRVKISVEIIKRLTMQACALRGHDERPCSMNRGNFLELLKFLSSYNKEVENVVLDNAQQNSQYTSPDVQKEILHIFARNVQRSIRDEIGNAKFCLIVDECRDESKKEQMEIVVRFVDQDGHVKERFLDLVHVKDTTALTLKNEILSSLSFHKFDFQDIRGQSYDGARQATPSLAPDTNGLILKECPYAYYIHCFAHQMQLALVAASKEVVEVHKFFKNLNFIINVIDSSSKRHDQIQDAQISEISLLAETGELETGKGVNQIQSLQRPGDTIWSSHYRLIRSLLRLYGPVIVVLHDIAINGSTSSQKSDASFDLTHLLSFDFVFVMRLMKKIMKKTDKLCQALQRKSQDIVNALSLVSTIKSLIQNLRDEGWQSLFDKVVSFSENNNIQVPEMSQSYKDIIRSHSERDNVTVEHHYRVDVFFAAIDKQENIQLKSELQHCELDFPNDPELKNVQTIAELCRGLQKTGRVKVYPMLDRLIRLVFILPVSTAISERAFSTMKIMKTRLRCSMSDDYFKSCLILYIERDIADSFTSDEITDAFAVNKRRRVQLLPH
ncbi:uncharacterized protein [Rutidosis leptorrhynchoides]|uniref:uncharacterized protein n=1 Tax=Rutidosis leptorrhynchoides TaxID=125765 RepID=UPI003A995DAB